MSGTWLWRAPVRSLFLLYAAGLVGWLALGLVPTLAADLPAVHHWFVLRALHGSGVAERVLDPMLPGAMTDRTTLAQALLQYGFSLLNLALGGYLAVRVWNRLVPRLLAFALLGTAATFNLPSHRAFHIIGSPWPVSALHFCFHIVSGTCYLWAVVLFPDGRWPRRIRLGAASTAVLAVVVTAVIAFVSWRGSFLAHPQFFVLFFGVAIPVVGVAGQALRIVDGQTAPADRRAARLLCGALLPAFVTALLWIGGWVAVHSGWHSAHRFDDALQTLFPAAFALVPVVLFAAVARYRLWEVDRLVTRVLTYAAVVLVIGVAYVVAVTVSGALAGGQVIWTVLAVAAAVTVIDPVRSAARRWANRIVFGQDLTPTDAIRALIGGLESLGPTGELDQLTEVAVRATRASAAAVLVGDAELVAGTRPADGTTGPSARSWPIRYRGADLGVLAVTAPDGLTATDEQVLAELAEHAGIVVHNAALTTQLAGQVAALGERTTELRAARRRLVESHDAERRRLERDLHDGAQQSLVAAIAGISVIEVTAPAPDERRRDVEQLRAVLTSARQSVRELCSGDRPRALTDLGLAGALARAADAARVLPGGGPAVRVDVDQQLPALPADVEVAVYFSCQEAVQNALKHARARRIDIVVRAVGDDLVVTVADDGTGTAQDIAQGGLAGLRGRLAAVAGTVQVTSVVGAGTTVQIAVPLAVGAPARAPEQVGAR